MPHLRVPVRHPHEQFVASSLQFSVEGLPREQTARFVEACAAGGVHVKWFGAEAPAGFTSAWSHWQYINEAQQLPNAARVLAGLCDLRLPLTLGRGDCIAIAGVLRRAMADTVSTGPSSSTAV